MHFSHCALVVSAANYLSSLDHVLLRCYNVFTNQIQITAQTYHKNVLAVCVAVGQLVLRLITKLHTH